MAQVYLRLPDSTGEAKRLVARKKVFLESGQEQQVTISVAANDSSHPLSYWDSARHAWLEAPGQYTVYLGNSSADVTQVGAFEVPRPRAC